MQAVIFIPARYQSSRFPGKPLANLTGATGVSKSLIERSWVASRAVAEIDDVFVLTDSKVIADAVGIFGGQALMTPATCRNGTERCAEAVKLLEIQPDVVINFQGDAPLTPPHYVEALLAAMVADPSIPMATPVLRTPRNHLEKLL
ncbi:MAG: 3-deoxy-manno-octulosonate cytidylyltransferase, partial [Boseongicola sp.]